MAVKKVSTGSPCNHPTTMPGEVGSCRLPTLSEDIAEPDQADMLSLLSMTQCMVGSLCREKEGMLLTGIFLVRLH